MRVLQAIRKFIPWWIPVLFQGVTELVAMALFLATIAVWAGLWCRVF